MKKHIILIISFLSFNLILNAQSQRLDSFEIKNYEINLNIVDFGSQIIRGNCIINLAPKLDNIPSVRLDLSPDLTIDSINIGDGVSTGDKVNYNRNGDAVIIDYNFTNSVEEFITVTYSGKPEKDPSGWGGFYFSGIYAFNLGVGFQVNPHNYGRAWFPCFDEFKSRSTYTFNITTSSTNKAFCNGLLINEQDNGGTKTWTWQLTEPIPTYLASVAIAPYVSVKGSYNGINGPIPTEIACLAADSNNAKTSFENLNKAIEAFESFYGPHTFSRIGFNLVPFNGGAMEHATNIAYPRSAANGTKDRETLFAHELSHHWWGNTVTCSTPEDMWINEGWASYSENIFTESVYGYNQYRKAVDANQLNVLRWAHIRDGEARAVSGVPHEYTYGMHVYDKGADMVEVLRNLMGKDSFISAATDFLMEYKFQAVSSIDLRDHFQKYTNENLTSFFNDYIFTKGFPHYEIISIKTSQNGNEYQNEITIRHRQRFNEITYKNVPYYLRFYGNSVTTPILKRIYINQYEEVFVVNTFFLPKYVQILHKGRGDATTTDRVYTPGGGLFDLENALMDLNITESSGEVLLDIEHHWIGPGNENNPIKGLYLSNSRYWSIDGITPATFVANATVIYDARTPSSQTAGYLDHNHIKNTEDSLVLMYRAKKTDQWVIWDDYTKNTGNTSDGYGSIVINNIKMGDYCFAMYDYKLGNITPEKKINYLSAYPNPTSGNITFKIDNLYKDAVIVVSDNKGSIVDQKPIYANENVLSFDTSNYANGVYHASLMVGEQRFDKLKFIKK